VARFPGQWIVEELFRRAKKGGVYAGGRRINGPTPRCGCIRCTVIGLMLVSLARLTLGIPEVRQQHDEDTVGDESHSGTRAHERAGAARDRDACPT